MERLETGIAIADDVIAVARQEIAFDVGGLARLNAAAEPYERASVAPWLKKFNEDGKEVVRVLRMIGNGPWDGRWLEPTPQELEDGVFYPDGDAYERAQRGGFVTKEKHNGDAST